MPGHARLTLVMQFVQAWLLKTNFLSETVVFQAQSTFVRVQQ